MVGVSVHRVAASFLLWTVVYRKEKVVRYSQPFFLGMIASGALFSSSAIIPLAKDDSYGGWANETGGNDGADSGCRASVWLYSEPVNSNPSHPDTLYLLLFSLLAIYNIQLYLSKVHEHSPLCFIC